MPQHELDAKGAVGAPSMTPLYQCQKRQPPTFSTLNGLSGTGTTEPEAQLQCTSTGAALAPARQSDHCSVTPTRLQAKKKTTGGLFGHTLQLEIACQAPA